MATAAPARDITVKHIGQVSWSADNVLVTLDQVKSFAEQQATSAIEWYYRKKRPKATASRILRFLAITLATAGGLMPIAVNLPDIKPSWQLERWGYVMLAAAAACLAIDKFFGFSSGWVRYLVTAQTIQSALSAFQIDWARATSRLTTPSPASPEVGELLQLARDFTVGVMKEVSQETQQWVVEFQSNLADLEKATKAQVEGTRPGSLTITVDNANICDSTVEVSVDGIDYGSTVGNAIAIRQISPGAHAVVVTGQKDGKSLQQSGMVTVPPGGTAKLELHLPNS